MWSRWVVLMLGLTLASGSMAEALKIGVVDLRAALLASNAAKKFGEELRREFADDEKRLKELGDQAKALQDRLQKDGPIMSDAERSQLASDLEEKAQEFNFLKNKYQSSVAKREEAFLQNSRPKIDEALRQIVEQGNFDLILPEKMVVHAKPALDVTSQLIEALNK